MPEAENLPPRSFRPAPKGRSVGIHGSWGETLEKWEDIRDFIEKGEKVLLGGNSGLFTEFMQKYIGKDDIRVSVFSDNYFQDILPIF